METMKMLAAMAMMLLGGGSVVLSMFAALIPGGMDMALAMLLGGMRDDGCCGCAD
jgi:hypothetical protein